MKEYHFNKAELKEILETFKAAGWSGKVYPSIDAALRADGVTEWHYAPDRRRNAKKEEKEAKRPIK